MKLQKQVCRLSQAKRLKELGVIQTSLFFIDETDHVTFWGDNKDLPKTLRDTKLYAAFTVAELGIMLPYDNNDLIVECYYSPHGGSWEAYLKKQENDSVISLAEVEDETEAEARAALLILILEVKEINVDQVNERLVNSNL